MAFQFPLATVLRFRESIERREERALQRVQMEMARVSRQLDELNVAIAQAHSTREQAMQQTMPAGHLHTMVWEAQAAVERRNFLLATLQTLDQQREKQMKIYQAAHRDRETLINLFNRQRSEYEQRQVRAQQKYLDDIFVARRQRN
jgi:flagellar export protein FliJ